MAKNAKPQGEPVRCYISKQASVGWLKALTACLSQQKQFSEWINWDSWYTCKHD